MTRSIHTAWITLVAILVLLVAGFSASSVSGQPAGEQSVSGNGFRISPVTSDFVIEPGQSEILTITVENPTELPTIAVPFVNDFIAGQNEDGEVLPILDENAPAAGNSFRSLVGNIDEIELGPRERRDIEVTISVPEDANAGGYYGIVRFQPRDVNESGNVTLSASVGSIALVRVPGDLSEQLNLVQLSAAQGDSLRSFFTGGEVSTLIRLENAGNIHVQPFGRVQIKNMFGDVVESFELNDVTPRAYILPDTIRRFQDDLEGTNWFGRYTIEANIGYSQGSGEVISAQTTFWYVPVWALIALFVAIAAIAFGVVTLVNRRGNSKKR